MNLGVVQLFVTFKQKYQNYYLFFHFSTRATQNETSCLKLLVFCPGTLSETQNTKFTPLREHHRLSFGRTTGVARLPFKQLSSNDQRTGIKPSCRKIGHPSTAATATKPVPLSPFPGNQKPSQTKGQAETADQQS